MTPRLVLASGSARRRDLLARLGLEFDVSPPEVDESRRDDESPDDYVRRTASSKLSAVRSRNDAPVDGLVVAADTAVVVDGEILGKPVDAGQARQMLARLADRSHLVVTAVAVGIGPEGPSAVDTEATTVHFGALSGDRLSWYLGTDEGADKAGGYAIQGAGGLFADRVEGSVTNVIGLPLPLLDRLCREVGADLLSFRRAR